MQRIGIVGWKTGENSFGATLPYLNYLGAFGQVEILTPRGTESIPDVDLIIMPGGADVSPNLYGEVPAFTTSNPDVFKEHFLVANLGKIIEAGIPVFGICLGMQQLNVHFGGTLIQHKDMDYSKSRDEQIEDLELENVDFFNSKFYDNLPQKFKNVFFPLKAKQAAKVNSLHHQCVTKKGLAPDLVPLFTSKKWTNVEMFAHRDLPIAGVQWHPEEFDYQSYINTFVNQIILSMLHKKK